MPKSKKSYILQKQAKGRGGEWNGGDVTWTGEDTNKHIEKWMKSMGMLVPESEVKEQTRLDECIIVGGCIGNNFILAKNRDRKYMPTIEVVRKLSKGGVEMVLMYDKRTQYVEGMNEYGIGIINSTLLNEEDSRSRSGYNNRQGNIIHRALCSKTLDEAIGILSTHSGGIEGHTLVADAVRMFHVELTHGRNAYVEQLDPSTGWDARTNHGIHFSEAGYMPRDGMIYMSSNYRKAMAEIELNQADSPSKVLSVLRQQHNDPASHLNMHRRVPEEAAEHGGFHTTNQIAMDLSDLHFYFHCYTEHCDFQDIKDLTPDEYESKIKITVTQSDH